MRTNQSRIGVVLALATIALVTPASLGATAALRNAPPGYCEPERIAPTAGVLWVDGTRFLLRAGPGLRGRIADIFEECGYRVRIRKGEMHIRGRFGPPDVRWRRGTHLASCDYIHGKLVFDVFRPKPHARSHHRPHPRAYVHRSYKFPRHWQSHRSGWGWSGRRGWNW